MNDTPLHLNVGRPQHGPSVYPWRPEYIAGLPDALAAAQAAAAAPLATRVRLRRWLRAHVTRRGWTWPFRCYPATIPLTVEELNQIVYERLWPREILRLDPLMRPYLGPLEERW